MSDTAGSAGDPTPAAEPVGEGPAAEQTPADQASDTQPGRKTRREFLIGAATASVAAAGAAYLTHELRAEKKLAALSPSHARRVAAVQPVVRVAPRPRRADWAALRAQLSTSRLLRPREDGYDQARHLFEPRFDSLQPAAVAYCRTAADVATCLSFVKKFQLPVRVRSGGHSYAGWSSVNDGLIVDVSPMNSVSFDSADVTVGAGLDLIRFYTSLGARGLAVPGATCPTVGIAGLALGGGIGPLTRLLGTTSDNVTAMEVVTADGSQLTCSAPQNPDLLWACRGGGGGNFGVTTSLTFGTTRLRQLCVFVLSWPWSHAARVIRAWQSWAPHGPDRLSSTVRLSAPFGGSPALTVTGTYAGPAHVAARQLDALYAQIGVGPAASSLHEMPYVNAMLFEPDCSPPPGGACHAGPGGAVPRVPSFAKSDFFTRPLRAHATRVLLTGIEDATTIKGAAGGVAAITLDACGAAMSQPSPSATAFVHRDALFLAEYSTTWTSPGNRSAVLRQRSWLRTFYQSLHPHASGQAYQNYVDPDLADWSSAYYGANYPWLTVVKMSVDPGNMFQFPQSILPG
jgi:hypothetical protein